MRPTTSAAGLKGRFQEERRDDDHHLHDDIQIVPSLDAGAIDSREAPALSALNTTLQDDYIADCAKGVDRWNRALADVGVELRLPHRGFNRAVGVFRDAYVSPSGELLTQANWDASRASWLPTPDDEDFVHSLMTPVTEPGKMAGWVAAPSVGINGKPVDFAYVRVA